MFGVVVVRLTKAYMELLPRDRKAIMGYMAGQRLWSRGCQSLWPAPKYLKSNEFLDFFHSCNMFTIYLDYV